MTQTHLPVLLIAFLCMAIDVSAQVDTVSIDLGGTSNMSPPPWNNLTSPESGKVDNCLNHKGFVTGIAVAVTDAFNGTNYQGLAAHDSLGVIEEASGDSFFGSAVEAVGGHEVTGGVTLYDLDPATAYSFGFFGSRDATDNRDTKYIVEGASRDSACLDVAGNAAYMASVKSVYPKADGTIVITATTGPDNTNSSGYYYLGAVKITFVNPNPPSDKALQLVYPNGDEYWEVGKTPKIKWKSTNVLNVGIEYSADSGVSWNPVTSSGSALSGEHTWSVPSTVSDNCLVRIFDISEPSVADTSDHAFKITEAGPERYRIVVIGSSTAAGNGPSSLDSAWVWRYSDHLTQNDTRFEVFNLAKGGLTTYNLLPTGTPISGVSESVDEARNITKAMSYKPNAVIVNLPSNDAAGKYSIEDQLKNYELIAEAATEGGAFFWVTTPQPRDFSDPAKNQLQLDMVEATYETFGDFTIDFWTGFHEQDGTMADSFDSGDGIHMNDQAHKILFERVVDKGVAAYIMNNRFPLLATGLEDKTSEGFEVYPNPAYTHLYLKFDKVKDGELIGLKIFNMSCKLVYEQSVSKTSPVQIDISSLPEGIWLLHVATKESNSAKLFFKTQRSER